MCTGTLTGNTSGDTLKTTLSSSQIIDKPLRPRQNIERTYCSLDYKLNLTRAVPGTRPRKCKETPSCQLNGIKLRSWPLHSGHGYQKVCFMIIAIANQSHTIINTSKNKTARFLYQVKTRAEHKATRVLKEINKKEVRTYKCQTKTYNKRDLDPQYPTSHKRSGFGARILTHKASARVPPSHIAKITERTCRHCVTRAQSLTTYILVLESNKTYTSKQALINAFEYFLNQERKSYKQVPAYKRIYTQVTPVPEVNRTTMMSYRCEGNPHTCTLLHTASTLYRQKSYQTSTFEYFFTCTRRNMTYVKSVLTTVKTGMTAVKIEMTAVKLGLTAVKPRHSRPPTKMDSSTHPHPPTFINLDSSKTRLRTRERHVLNKVRIPTKYIQRMPNKVQTPTKYKFLKVQMSREHHVGSSSSKVQNNVPPSKYKSTAGPPTKYKFLKVQISRDQHVDSNSTAEKRPDNTWARDSSRHTPYGPHNLPHMVLRTKKGSDNA